MTDEILCWSTNIDITDKFSNGLPQALDSIVVNFSGLSDTEISGLSFYAVDNSEEASFYTILSNYPWSCFNEEATNTFNNASAASLLNKDALAHVVIHVGYDYSENKDNPCAVITMNGGAEPVLYSLDGSTVKCTNDGNYIIFKDGISSQKGSYVLNDGILVLDDKKYYINEDNSLSVLE